MSDKTGISWTEATWNPVAGCSIVSPGCKNCYAMEWAGRILDKPGSHYHKTTEKVKGKSVWTGLIAVAPDHIFYQPLRWTRGRKIFVNSMSDLFHPNVPRAVQIKVFAIAALTPHHIYQILTKRHAEMLEVVNDPKFKEAVLKEAILLGCTAPVHNLPKAPPSEWPLANVWLGVSAEDQERWDERVQILRKVQAAVRFVSVEPQIEEINPDNLAMLGIHWVICGGESGRQARPFAVRWATLLRKVTKANGVAFFMKQMGSNCSPAYTGKGDTVEEWPEELRVQEFPS